MICRVSLVIPCLVLLLLPERALASRTSAGAERTVEADLLVVGGTEAGVAAAVQAARMGVKRIVLVNDIAWLGGQFSAEGVGAIDEWTAYRGKRTEFPRSGTFLEMLRLIRRHNGAKYGTPRPGNSFCASETVEPAAAAQLFAEWVAPYAERGTNQIRILRPYQPVAVTVEAGRVTAVTFENVADPKDRILVRAVLTVDASDWGDVIRLSGAKWSAGPDLKARFGEPNAPAGPLGDDRNEMNPITYCLVLREAGKDATIPKPAGYDERAYLGTTAITSAEFKKVGWPTGARPMNVPPFADTAYPEGIYSAVVSVYTHRRLVDRRHNGLPTGSEKVLLNWPTQDYPLYDFPRHVADALEATEKGASTKNVVAMTPAQRRIVFDDAKRHALGMLYHLQTTVHARAAGNPLTFRDMELTDEFGTPDRLPPKPYVREGLRLEALYMLREGDLRMRGKEPGWAKHMVPDNVFGFQFNIDFHPTRRVFLNGDRSGPWANVHTANRNWSTHTDRAGFPLRSLVPVEMNGLLGASKNLGVSSIVSSAVRLHGQMMLTGQAAGTAAALCLRNSVQPRALARDPLRVRELQRSLVRGVAGMPGVLLWPYQDLSPDDLHFEAANLLAVRAIFVADDGVDFQPWKQVTRRELARALARAARSLEDAKPWHRPAAPLFRDLLATDPDRPYAESLRAWGVPVSTGDIFRPEEGADWKTLHAWMAGLGWKPSDGLARRGALPLTRAELVQHLWLAIKDRPEWFPETRQYLRPSDDSDGDGIPDLEDALPFDRDNNGVPDRLDPQTPN